MRIYLFDGSKLITRPSFKIEEDAVNHAKENGLLPSVMVYTSMGIVVDLRSINSTPTEACWIGPYPDDKRWIGHFVDDVR